MRLLFTIPHYVSPPKEADGAGGVPDAAAHAQATTKCLLGLRQLFAPTPCMLDHGRGIALPIMTAWHYHIDIVLCTTGDWHLLDQLPANTFEHRATKVEPTLLGFACHDVLRERLGAYDYYCYLEDDLVLHDAWWFVKLRWFTQIAGDMCVLQPNRYEAGLGGLAAKLYIDGDVAPHFIYAIPEGADAKPITAEVMGVPVVFERPQNPHAGCFFLNARQMGYWAQQPHFKHRPARLAGPLDAATLGILRTFKVFKPAMRSAGFLEVQHHGSRNLQRLCSPNMPAQPAR
jgi:hypothetical protein